MQLQHMKQWAATTLLAFGSASVLAMAPSLAAADELSALKAQLEALQSQVDALESRPTYADLPDGVSLLTMTRGSMIDDGFARMSTVHDHMPLDRGFTFAVTPTADLPAPVHEVTVSGYVKGDVILDLDGDHGDFFNYNLIGPDNRDGTHLRMHARQSRFRIRSRSDTAIGQIRTWIEGDFFGGDDSSVTTSSLYRLRHAWGEWEMTPVWTFGAGQTWSNFMPLFDLADTNDFNGPAGGAFARQGQVRVTYESGPILAAFAVENPSTAGDVFVDPPMFDPTYSLVNGRIPDFTGRLDYTFPGQHKVAVTGIVGENRAITSEGNRTETLWGVIGAAQFHLTDRIIVTGSGGTGEGHGRYIIGTDVGNNLFLAPGSADLDGRRFWHGQGHVNFSLTDTVTFNAAYGRVEFRSSDTEVGQTDWLQTVHANVWWQPVRQLKMGVEGMWAERKIDGEGTFDAARVQFGAFFFF
jgi:hypothetical protein